MGEMNKLIITATTANSWLHPELKNWAMTTDDLIEDAIQCAEAGAAILHIHLPRGPEAFDIVRRIRSRTDAIIQAGMSSYPIEERDTDFEARPDMLSIILNHHDEHFAEMHVNRLHPLDEFEKYCVKCREYGIKPEWEVWHTGSYWNLQYMIYKKWITGPHVLTFFFGWPGGTWTPPTPDSYFYRVRHMPPDCLHTISVMGKEQAAIATLAIATGGNVRVGTEDYPFISIGVPARNNAELIKRIVTIARFMGREVATPADARKMIGGRV
jgi:3-keto-5-aminohexanoate cleavage enzyme